MTGLDYLPAVARPRDAQPETEVERAKRLMVEAAELIDSEWNPGVVKLCDELRDCAENILAEDQYDAIITVLTRMSGKPTRFVKRVLKSKLGVTE